MTEETEEVGERKPSRAREITGTVAATATALVLTGVANALIARISAMVHDRITGKTEEETEEEAA